MTKRFFEHTREFIKNLDVPDEQKSDLLTGLYAYLKIDQSPSIEIGTFSNQYLAPDLKDDYATFMRTHNFPMIAVSKDTSDIQAALRNRRLTFSRNIQLIAPPDAFEELVQVRSIDGEPDKSGCGRPGRR